MIPTRTIPLTRGFVAIIDADDWDMVSRHKWAAQKGGNSVYARTSIRGGDGKQYALLLHRLLLKSERGTFVDHIDGDGLNNIRANLRACSHAENIRNSAVKTDKRKRSKFKGVGQCSGTGRWRASIEKDGSRLDLGTFDTEERAARAYDAASRLFHGRFSRNNKDLGLLP
jgi:hypothetical protein